MTDGMEGGGEMVACRRVSGNVYRILSSKIGESRESISGVPNLKSG